METHKRTVAKTLSWRLVATVITTAITFALTRKLEFAATVGVLDTIVKFGSYYVHERLWNNINFGRAASETEYEI